LGRFSRLEKWSLSFSFRKGLYIKVDQDIDRQREHRGPACVEIGVGYARAVVSWLVASASVKNHA
jgi:hypothetical protein